MFVLKHLQSSAWTFPPWGRCPDPTPHPPAKSGLKSLTASASSPHTHTEALTRDLGLRRWGILGRQAGPIPSPLD